MTENRLQNRYWAEVVQLKVSCEYARRYRDRLESWVTGFAVIRAGVSVTALGTWAVVKAYPMVCGGIIAAAQVADAVQTAIPFVARFRGANALLAALEALLIDCLMEWEDIYAGRINEGEIAKRLYAMMKRAHDADVKNLPNGLPEKKSLFKLAEADAAAYFERLYSQGAPQ